MEKVTKIQNQELSEKAKEASLLAGINHPSIVKYYDSFWADGQLIIVMEWCEKGDLESFLMIRNKVATSLPEPKIWKIIIEILLGLEFLNSHHIIHRDIKPKNIFLARGQEAKIGDFGVGLLLPVLDCENAKRKRKSILKPSWNSMLLLT
jgi:serine/threonine protein kinase